MIGYILLFSYIIYFVLHCILFSYSIYKERYERFVYLRDYENNNLESSELEII
jgi:hypothetical protein